MEVIILRREGAPIPESDLRPPWRGILTVEKVARRRVARLIQLADTPARGVAPTLLDPVILKLIGDRFVLGGLEEVWVPVKQANEEMRQAWGVRRVSSD